jgi:ferritin
MFGAGSASLHKGGFTMMSDKMQKAINDQINAELYSAYLYLAMEAYFQSKGLAGFANWMRVQTQEEIVHAMKMYDFINARSGRVELKQIDSPPLSWDSPLKAFEAAYKHETIVTGRINKLVDLAIRESDHATHNFLQWFVAEQVEEEQSASTVVEKLKLIGSSGEGLFQLDKELGTRVFTPPAQTAQ